MKIILIVICLSLSACSWDDVFPREKYELESGEVVECRFAVEEECGVKLSDCWLWIDSQESEPVSPGMLDEFFLPYMAEVCALGGLVYYGCCEGLDDRFEQIEKKIPNLRAVSVSGWNDLFKMGEMIDKKYVYSRKPVPAYISGTTPDWDRLKKDIKDTLAGANNCSLEFCYRDIYTVNGDRKRLSDWVRMVRSMIGE